MGRVEHEGVAEEEVEAEQNYYCVLERLGREGVHLRGYYLFDAVTPQERAEKTERNVQHANEANHWGHNPEVCLRVTRHVLHGQDYADAFVGVDGEAETRWPPVGLECRYWLILLEFVPLFVVGVHKDAHDDDVQKSNENHDVCENVCRGKDLYFSDPAQQREDQEADGSRVPLVVLWVECILENRVEVRHDEADIGATESRLRQK